MDPTADPTTAPDAAQPAADQATEHDWQPVPGYDGYEVCRLTGLVRSLLRRTPRVLRGHRWRGKHWYVLSGDAFEAKVLEAMTFGDQHVTTNDRTLTAYELEEIRNEEGLKPAFVVAEEFRIDVQRVHAIWNGLD